METSTATSSRNAIALSELPLLGSLLRWRWFPYVFQALSLAVVVTLAWLGLRSIVPEGVDDKLVAKGSLVTLLVWGLWWPAMVWSAVILGRAWCTVCPLELVSNMSERLGRRFGIGGRTMGRWLRGGSLVLILYLAMQMLVAGMSLHRSAVLTAWVIIALVGVALVTGLVYRDRAFCRGFCPVSLLLSTYGRSGALAMRAASPAPCRACGERVCTSDARRTAADARSCPSLLDPSRLSSNADCLLCGQCIKVCPESNMQMTLRAPFDASDSREARPRLAKTLFVVFASGFVIAELAAEWDAAKAIVQWGPHALAAAVGVESVRGWVNGIWIVLVLPALLWLLFGLIAAEGNLRRLTGAIRTIALPMAVVVAAGHMAKAFVKGTSWVGFLPGALGDPTNHALSSSIAAGSIPKPSALVSTETAMIVGLALVALGMFLALRELRRCGALSVARAIPVVILTLVYAGIIAGWG